jgi:hypothetical protein
MIITKYSKVDSLELGFFNVVSVSETLTADKDNEIKIMPLTELLPPAELMKEIKAGDISEKKFDKKYAEFLKTDAAEYALFTVGLALKDSAKDFCFICSDKEWEYGYLQTLGETISELFGIKVSDVKKTSKAIKKSMDAIPKKVKKDEKKFKKELKTISKELKSSNKFSSNGEENMDFFRRKYALDQVISSVAAHGMISFNENNELMVNKKEVEKKMKSSSFIKAIFAVYESDKTYKKVIKKVLSSHDIKLDEKKLKKLSNEELIHLAAECVTGLQASRYDLAE